jgi:hypothetical protein
MSRKPEAKERRPAPDTELLKKIAGAASRFKTAPIEKLVKGLNAFRYEPGGDLPNGWLNRAKIWSMAR